MLVDQYNRVHDYLRISLTDRCNFRCTYCMPELRYACAKKSELMTADEIASIAAVFIQQGVKKIRLTGGEPLLRPDFSAILKSLSKFNIELTLTTNGSLIDRYINDFRDAGISSVNVSLDSLNKTEFLKITGKDRFTKVWSNILLLLENNIKVKLNVVAMRGKIESELYEFLELTRNFPLHIRFIEFMPFSGNNWSNVKVITAQELIGLASQEYDLIKVKDEPHSTAKKYVIPGHKGSVAFITTMSCQFCRECNRLRLTSEGKLKNCLHGKEEYDILSLVRAGKPLMPLIEQALKGKAKEMGGQFANGYQDLEVKQIVNRSMVRIGG